MKHSIVHIRVEPGMTDEQIRLVAQNSTLMNAAYATTICRNCGNFKCHPEGCWKTAIIVDYCPDCRPSKWEIL